MGVGAVISMNRYPWVAQHCNFEFDDRFQFLRDCFGERYCSGCHFDGLSLRNVNFLIDKVVNLGVLENISEFHSRKLNSSLSILGFAVLYLVMWGSRI